MSAHLFQETKCRHLLYTSEVEDLVQPLKEHITDLQLHKIGTFEDMIQPGTKHYPYDKEYDAVKWDPVLVLYSNSSTGPPDPIVMNHATFAVGDNDRNVPTVPGRVNHNWSLWDFPKPETFFSAFPVMHVGQFTCMAMLPIFYQNAKVVLFPPTEYPSGKMISQIMDQFDLKAVLLPPIAAEQLLQEPDGLEKCKKLKFLLYGGGPLARNIGDALSKVTEVCQFYGQGETGCVQALVPHRDDWDTFEWHPSQEIVMDPVGVDDLYEMTMHRNPALEKLRGISTTYPDVAVWRTHDLFRKHPTKPNLWLFHGRSDDVIVLSTAAKVNPRSSEALISAHPLLKGALMAGQGYAKVVLILEPEDASQTPESLVEAVWPTIEEANAQTSIQGRVTKEMILVAPPSKPFVRFPNGPVLRAPTTQQYKDEMAELYARVSK